MGKVAKENRSFPRIKTDLRVSVFGNIFGESTDLSEGGLNFNSSEVISSPTISLKIRFPKDNFELKTNARLVWKRDLDSGNSMYGVEFVDLKETQRSTLRKELIKTQINELLSEIKSKDIREQISNFFFRDILDYVTKMIGLASNISCHKEHSVELQKEFDHWNNQIMLKGYCLEELLSDKRVMQKIKENFRKLTGTWVYKSVIVKRAFEKPRGYPGDYKMLEIVYDNKPMSEGFGLYFDNYFLKNPYSVAVRIRKDRLREMLRNYINETKLNKIDILNIACGSCRELLELFPEIKTKSPIAFTCLDWDEKALSFSKKVLSKNTPPHIKFNFVREDIMNMLKAKSPQQSYGTYNLIYSIGLIDYLPDRVLKKLIQVLYKLLHKNGKLILTHKNREKTFPPLPPDWFCDWKFVSRSKEEVIKLFRNCDLFGHSLLTEVDEFEYIYYFTITKEKTST